MAASPQLLTGLHTLCPSFGLHNPLRQLTGGTCWKVGSILNRFKPGTSKVLHHRMSSQASKDHPEGQKPPLLVDDHTVATVRESKILVLLRGLPGSGKSTLAKDIEQKYKDTSRLISADLYEIKPVVRSSSGGDYAKLDADLTTCFEKREASLVILDDTHHDRERLDKLFDMANTYHFAVVVLEPKTPWRLDCAQLKDRNHWKLSLEELKNLRPTLEKDLLPLYFGWFLAKRDEDYLRKTSHEFLEQLGNLKAFKKRLQPFGYEDKHKLDLMKHFAKSPNILHCTSKFCDYGKIVGSEEYAQQEAVKKAYSKGYTLHLSALFVTPRTVGAQVELTADQLLLWPSDAEKEVMPKDTLPRGSRAHITLGTAADVQDVQTGIDLLEFVKLQQSGKEGENLGEMSGSVAGKVSYYDNGMWMLNLSQKIEVRSIFSGYYGKPGVSVPLRGSKKGILNQCQIM
ncbi:2',3'-cyclic-nucleotide 3'-phosphodiesterase-like [Bufo gargarizans]|uniref:2',3'-cyclic-nucleotide 3'-phosphodiesterase-like n=1 Tax=Bufo gargarizans TaxID=30331 RepID=UPI001CF58238|nr:2',3'-cyclic-nucleotide 3'-phosphodiesterase-like [Bufo gargarizans]